MHLAGAAASATMVLACAGCATSHDYPRRPNAQEMGDIEGVYGLSDGFRAHIYQMGTDLYVRIGAGNEKRLMMIGPNRFRSDRGDVTIHFQPQPDDVADRVTVAYYRRPDARPPIMFSSGLRPGRGFLD
jgi:hypothetical protein